jgi:hypothetical protein
MLPKIIGCEDFPKSEHGKLLIEDIDRFINEHYRYDGKKVIEAFEAAATHSLFLDGKRIDPSTFGKFLSRAVVGKVLTAYKESKRDSNASPKGYNPNQLPAYRNRLQEPHEPIKPHEAYELILKWCKEDGKLPFVAPYERCYLYLVEKGAIKPVKNKKQTGRFGRNAINFKRQRTEEWFTKNVINKQKQTT